jgi:hypothetical protein
MSRSGRPGWNGSGGWILVCAIIFSLAITGLSAWSRAAAALKLSNMTLPRGAMVERSFESPTGYKNGLRYLVMPAGQDGCHWIANAQRVAQGEWRLRTTDADNAPAGRPVHWSGSVAWWLALCGSVSALLRGSPVGAEIELAALWAMPLAHAALIVAIPIFSRRRFGNLAAASLAIGMGCSYSFAGLFFAAAPDHHGLVAAALLCMVLLAAAGRGGWSTASRPFRASVFVWSGVAAGVALWMSAATALPCIAGLLLGAGAGALLLRRAGWQFHARAWRDWGLAAGATSLALYLLEYFPSHLEMRLEVVHPLYALALAGAGWLVCLAGFLRDGHRFSPSMLLALLAGLLATLAPALAVFASGFESFRVADPMLWKLHRDHIHEFAPFLEWARNQSPQALGIYLSPLPLLILIALPLMWQFRACPGSFATMVIAIVPAGLLMLLGLGQVRWMTTSGVLWLAPLAVITAFMTSPANTEEFSLPRGLLGTGRLIVVGVVAAMVWFMPSRVLHDSLHTARGDAPLTAGDFNCLYVREVAHRMKALSGGRPAVVASSPTASTWLSYYGGHQTLGTLYWENLPGLEANARLYAAADEQEVLRHLRERNVDFLAFFAFEPFEEIYPKLVGGAEGTAFVNKLSRAWIEPGWARFVPMPVFAEFGTARVFLFDVRPARRGPATAARQGLPSRASSSSP